MKKTIVTFLFYFLHIIFAQSQNTNNLNYTNIIIISDLSSRVNSKKFPLKDEREITKIINYFKDICVRPGQKLGDMSCLSFHTFSDLDPFIIDLSKFENIGVRQKFINSTSQFRNNGFVKKIDDFNKHVNRIYSTMSNKGLDLISILTEKIQNKFDLKLSVGGNSPVKYENHLYVFTDGYLEYKIQGNNQFYFGQPQIANIRKYCIKNKLSVTSALNKNPSLGIPATRSGKNKQINIHILETHERDKNVEFLTYENQSGFRDNEILEAVWRKWAIESGFKSFEWKKY